MPTPNFLILYVDNPLVSADFYAHLLGVKPIDAAATFALFALDNGNKLGLWAKTDVEPAASQKGGGAEIGFPVADNAQVDALHAAWRARGLPIVQAPVQMDFGYTFVALDPDQHRLRVFAPNRE